VSIVDIDTYQYFSVGRRHS